MSAALPDPKLTKLYRLEASVGEPTELGEIRGERRRIVPLTGGSFEGPEISGELLPGPNADWQTILPDGASTPSARRHGSRRRAPSLSGSTRGPSSVSAAACLAASSMRPTSSPE